MSASTGLDLSFALPAFAPGLPVGALDLEKTNSRSEEPWGSNDHSPSFPAQVSHECLRSSFDDALYMEGEHSSLNLEDYRCKLCTPSSLSMENPP